jgi:phage gp29-like protein
VVRLLGEALQRFGMGFLKATVKNPSAAFIATVQKVLLNVANGEPLVITPEIEVELLSLAGGGLDPIQKALQWHGDQISAQILGQTLTTSTGGSSGSYALASVHVGTQKYFTGFPRRDLEVRVEHQAFTQLIIKNMGDEYLDVVPGLDLGVYDHEEAAMVADYLKTGIDGGMFNPNETWMRDRMNVPPYDPATPKESILPDRIQERIVVNESPTAGPGNSKTTNTDTGGA